MCSDRIKQIGSNSLRIQNLGLNEGIYRRGGGGLMAVTVYCLHVRTEVQAPLKHAAVAATTTAAAG